jgi:hypothetical protein
VTQQLLAGLDLVVSWLNTNAGAIQAVATVVLVIVGSGAFLEAAIQAKAANAAVKAANDGLVESRRQALLGSLVLFDLKFETVPRPSGTSVLGVTILNQTDAPAFRVGVGFWLLDADEVPAKMPAFVSKTFASLAPRDWVTVDADEPAILELGRFLVRVYATSSLGAETRMDFDWVWNRDPAGALKRVEVDLGREHDRVVWPGDALDPTIYDPWSRAKPKPGHYRI